jgi:hypothetical protein
VLAERLTTHPDILRELLAAFVDTVMAPKPMHRAATGRANVAPSAPSPATNTDIVNSIPAQVVGSHAFQDSAAAPNARECLVLRLIR